MSGYEPSDNMRAAATVFMNAVRHEAIPLSQIDRGSEAPDHAKALAVLRACADPEPQASGAEPEPAIVPARAEPDPAVVKPYSFPTLEQSVSTSEGVPPFQPPTQNARLAHEQAIANERASEPEAEQPAEQAKAEEAKGEEAPKTEGTPQPTLLKDAEPARPIATPEPVSQSLLAVKKKVALKNARAGEAYTDRLTIEGARELKLVNAGRTGLAFDEEACVFSGTPDEAGDHEIQLKGRIDNRLADITATLIVVADPKSLWTSLPSDMTDRFYKPDEAFTTLDGPALRMIGASKRGRSHAKTGGFREDDFAFAVHKDWHIAAVADGAGSATYSRRGSKLAVETVTSALPSLIDQRMGDEFEALVVAGAEGEIRTRLYETLVTAAFTAAEALVAQAEQLNESPSKLSTTIIVAVAKRFGDRWFVGSFSIGDGGAALLDLNANTVQPLTSPDSGEYAGQTRFLAKPEFQDSAEVMKRIHFAIADRFTVIALMSDGITDPKLPTDKVFADPAAWAALWNDDLTKEVDFTAPDEEIGKQFLAWLDFWSPGNHDDRTLAVLLPREG
jgi:serine/threonine protein phosphatase PrpC